MFRSLIGTITLLLAVCLPAMTGHACAGPDDHLVPWQSFDGTTPMVTVAYTDRSTSVSATSLFVGCQEIQLNYHGRERFVPWEKITQIRFSVGDWSALAAIEEQAIWAYEWREVSSWMSVPSLLYSIDGKATSLFALAKAWRTPGFLVLATEAGGSIDLEIIRYSALDWFEAVSVKE